MSRATRPTTAEERAGCVCDPTEWSDTSAINAVCASYDPEDCEDGAHCSYCQHDKECHR